MSENKQKTGLTTIRHELPKMFGVEGFQPTARMIEFAYAYRHMLEKVGLDEDMHVVSPAQLCRDGLGFSQSLYYKWQKKEGFQKWLQKVLNDWFGTTGLQSVYSAMYRRALQNSPQDAKMLLERFDREYKPQTSTEHKLAGIRPPDEQTEQQAIEASKQRVKAVADHD